MKKPEVYQTPLKKRSDIIAFLEDATHQRHYDGHWHPLCFNVKIHTIDLSFDHLLKLWRENEGNPLYTHNEDWLKAAKEQYDESEESLFDWGIEDARRGFTDSDSYNHLWDGTKIDVEYSFEGRSGGWLSITKFDGYKISQREKFDFTEMEYPTLRKLYQLVIMLKHDLKNPEKEVEWQAAFNFFANACCDIPQPNAIQKKLEFAETPA